MLHSVHQRVMLANLKAFTRHLEKAFLGLLIVGNSQKENYERVKVPWYTQAGLIKFCIFFASFSDSTYFVHVKMLTIAMPELDP